ncbi:hypothetical protein F9946_16930 [Burkholderia thailandensis]|nr:hypothetical protein [Burkholderia thailandensis]
MRQRSTVLVRCSTVRVRQARATTGAGTRAAHRLRRRASGLTRGAGLCVAVFARHQRMTRARDAHALGAWRLALGAWRLALGAWRAPRPSRRGGAARKAARRARCATRTPSAARSPAGAWAGARTMRGCVAAAPVRHGACKPPPRFPERATDAGPDIAQRMTSSATAPVAHRKTTFGPPASGRSIWTTVSRASGRLADRMRRTPFFFGEAHSPRTRRAHGRGIRR